MSLLIDAHLHQQAFFFSLSNSNEALSLLSYAVGFIWFQKLTLLWAEGNYVWIGLMPSLIGQSSPKVINCYFG